MMLKVQFRSSFKETLELSGITKLGNFSGNSTQSASTPKASFAGLSVSDILCRGSWSKHDKTFTITIFFLVKTCSKLKFLSHVKRMALNRGWTATITRLG